MTGTQKEASMSRKAKSFRAVLPDMSEECSAKLRRWSLENCASTAVSREDGDVVVWLATRDRCKTRENFMRSIRTTLRRLNIDARPRGRWLELACDEVVAAEAASLQFSAEDGGAQEPDSPSQGSPSSSGERAHGEDGGDEKVIFLRGGSETKPAIYSNSSGVISKCD